MRSGTHPPRWLSARALAIWLVLAAHAPAFAGNISVDGAYRWATPRLHTFWRGGNAFSNTELVAATYMTFADGYGIVLPETSVLLAAPVHLPQSAQISNLICYYYDNTAPTLDCVNNAVMELRRRRFDSATAEVLAQVTMNTCLAEASTVVRSSSDSTIVNPVVDNVAYNYFLHGQWVINGTPTTNLRFYGCLIDSGVQELKP